MAKNQYQNQTRGQRRTNTDEQANFSSRNEDEMGRWEDDGGNAPRNRGNFQQSGPWRGNQGVDQSESPYNYNWRPNSDEQEYDSGWERGNYGPFEGGYRGDYGSRSGQYRRGENSRQPNYGQSRYAQEFGNGQEYGQQSYGFQRGQDWGDSGYPSGYGWGADQQGQQGQQGQYVGRGPKGYKRSDDRIKEDVCERLTNDGHIDASEIEVEVSEGEVTLTGMVNERRAKRMVEDAVMGVSGVRDVNNQVRVTQGNSPNGSNGSASVDPYVASEGSGTSRRKS